MSLGVRVLLSVGRAVALRDAVGLRERETGNVAVPVCLGV